MVNVSHLGFCLLFLRTSIQISAYFKHRYFGALLLIWDFLTNFLNIGNLACIALVSPIAESYQQNWLLERHYGLQVMVYKLQTRLRFLDSFSRFLIAKLAQVY